MAKCIGPIVLAPFNGAIGGAQGFARIRYAVERKGVLVADLSMVHIKKASEVVGLSTNALRKLIKTGKVLGENRGRARVFVDIASVMAYKARPRTHSAHHRRRSQQAEMVCLRCVVPVSCHPGDPRCLYHFPKGEV